MCHPRQADRREDGRRDRVRAHLRRLRGGRAHGPPVQRRPGHHGEDALRDGGKAGIFVRRFYILGDWSFAVEVASARPELRVGFWLDEEDGVVLYTPCP